MKKIKFSYKKIQKFFKILKNLKFHNENEAMGHKHLISFGLSGKDISHHPARLPYLFPPSVQLSLDLNYYRHIADETVLLLVDSAQLTFYFFENTPYHYDYLSSQKKKHP